MATYRHWRIYVSTNNGGSSTAVREVEWRGSAGGADLTGSGTASASAGTAANGFDNSTATEWSVTHAVGIWLAYDFGSATSVVQLAVTGATTTSQSPAVFEVQASSNGSTWITIQAFNGSTWTSGQVKTFDFPESPSAAIGVASLAGYAVSGTAVGVAAANLGAYAVTGTGKGVAVANLAGYGVFTPASATTARPVINIVT